MKQLADRPRQNGVVVIMLVLVVFMAAFSVILAALNNRAPAIRQNLAIAREMQEARDALLAYATLFPDHYGGGPGRLPCPNSNNNPAGYPISPCAGIALGRLPQEVYLPAGNIFEIGNHNAGIDQQFWYAVSPEYRQSSSATLNSTILGPYSVDGESDIIAVLIAPGQSLVGQDRVGNPLLASNYLEGGNNTVPNFFNNTVNPDLVNDRVLPIRRLELMSLVTTQVAQTIRELLDVYHPLNGASYPSTAQFSTALASLLAPAWLATDNWPAETTYTFVNANTATLQFSDCSMTFTFEFGVAGLDRGGNFEC